MHAAACSIPRAQQNKAKRTGKDVCRVREPDATSRELDAQREHSDGHSRGGFERPEAPPAEPAARGKAPIELGESPRHERLAGCRAGGSGHHWLAQSPRTTKAQNQMRRDRIPAGR